MTKDNDLIRIDHERRVRGLFGVIAVVFGLILLAISATSSWGVREGYSSDLATLLLMSTCITIVAAVANLFRTRLLFGAVAQATFAFATMLFALLFAFASHISALGPSALANLLGAVLVASGGIARINGEVVEKVELIDHGRKYVYRDNRVVAVEQWVDGKLVSTRPVVPAIAR